MPKSNRCTAKTIKGTRCRGNCLTGADVCVVHSVKMTVCDMCEAPMSQAAYDEQDGYCSYACQSGGGKPVPAGCAGCAENQPNQMAHMGPGGCLEEAEEREEVVEPEEAVAEISPSVSNIINMVIKKAFDAVQRGDAAEVAQILDLGIDINARNSGWTLLTMATVWAHEELSNLLIERGADVNAGNSYGQRPLHFAVQKGLFSTAVKLLDADAIVNAVDDGGCTPLHYAAMTNQPKFVQLLLDRAANPSAKDALGKTARDEAAERGLKEIVEILEDRVRFDAWVREDEEINRAAGFRCIGCGSSVDAGESYCGRACIQ